MNNYFVNLFVTDQCNFNCRYCYEKDENTRKGNMDQETADEVIDFIKNTIQPDQQLIITFHGGEPLLRFSLITYIIDKIRKEIHNDSVFGITTNGSLLNEKTAQYLAENMTYKLSISLDGDEKTQSFNRPSTSHYTSFNDILKYACIMREKNELFTIRMTYDRHNINDLYNNIKFFIDKGFDRIIAEADFMSQEWEQEDFDVIYDQLMQTNLYISSINNRCITVYPANSPDVCLNKCNAGHDYYSISTSGKIYPCTVVINNDNFCLGDVKNGIDTATLSKIDEITSKETEGCSDCTHKKYCNAYRCFFLNYASMGHVYSANLVMCNMVNVKRLIDKKCCIKNEYHNNFEQQLSNNKYEEKIL